MKKLLNNPWIVGALAIAAVAFVAHSLLPQGAGAGSAVVSTTEVETAAIPEGEAGSAGSTEAGDIRNAMKELAATSSSRDPFASRAKIATQAVPVDKTPAPDLVETIHLTALWTQNGTTYALINDQICRVGDKVGRLTLESATQDGVWVTHWKGRDFLQLGSVFTLTTPALKAAALSISHDS